MLDAVDKPPLGQLTRLARWYVAEVEHFNSCVNQLIGSNGVPINQAAELALQSDWQLPALYSILSFDRLKDWKKLMIERKLHPWQELEVAKYDLLKPILDGASTTELLIDRYRLLVLGNGPGFAKHSVLLQLSRLDPKTWLADLQEFESYRFQILLEKIQTAKAQFDSELLDDALFEIKQTQWQATVPTALVTIVEQHKEQSYKDQVEYRLNELAKELLIHFESRDWESANRLKDEWKQLFASAESMAKDRVSGEVEDALSWAYADDEKIGPSHSTLKVITWLAASVLLFAVLGILIWLIY